MSAPTFLVVARKELKETWLGGRAFILLLAYAVFLSGLTFLLASDKELSLLAQRDAASLSIQLATAVGALLAMIASADALSGERERATLESLVATPASRLAIIAGKATAALSFWAAAYLVLVPYAWVITRDAGILPDALLLSLVLGTLLSLATVSFGMIVSSVMETNRASLSTSLLVFLLAAAPTQLPPTTMSGAVGQAFLKMDPMTASAKIIDAILANNHTWTDQAASFAGPLAWALGGAALLLAFAPMRIGRLRGAAS